MSRRADSLEVPIYLTPPRLNEESSRPAAAADGCQHEFSLRSDDEISGGKILPRGAMTGLTDRGVVIH